MARPTNLIYPIHLGRHGKTIYTTTNTPILNRAHRRQSACLNAFPPRFTPVFYTTRDVVKGVLHGMVQKVNHHTVLIPLVLIDGLMISGTIPRVTSPFLSTTNHLSSPSCRQSDRCRPDTGFVCLAVPSCHPDANQTLYVRRAFPSPHHS